MSEASASRRTPRQTGSTTAQTRVSWAATFLTGDINVVEAREPAALISRRGPALFVKGRRPNPVWLPRLCGLRLALIEFQFQAVIINDVSTASKS